MPSFEAPEAPKTLSEAGLPEALVEDLVLKHLMFLPSFTLSDVAERVKLPLSLLEPVIEAHRKENLVEVKGSTSYTRTSYVFRLTEAGRRRAQEAMHQCRYAGPAPVSLNQYQEVVRKQTIKEAIGGERTLREALSHLVIRDAVVKRLGPAMVSGQAIFLYGPSGNGKTSIAEALGKALPETVFIPYAVTVGGQVVTVFDPVSHVPAPVRGDAQREQDGRWVEIRRPVVSAGAELTLNMLDLHYNQVGNYYQASLQMKANNGLLIIDDLGRQRVDSMDLLNRWLVPLDRQVDHMTFLSGVKFAIPFDLLLIFSTELDPKDLVHEAFLRRLRYKIRVERPTDEEYLAIFRQACNVRGVPFDEESYRYLQEQWYGARGISRSACHPRDLVDLIVIRSRYYGNEPRLTADNIDAACTDYFSAV